MDGISLSIRGLETSAAQFTRSAAQTVRATAPAEERSEGPLASAESELVEGVTGQMVAMAGYRANLRSFAAALAMDRRTIDLLA